jgi:hypothetical protein
VWRLAAFLMGLALLLLGLGLFLLTRAK